MLSTFPLGHITPSGPAKPGTYKTIFIDSAGDPYLALW